jgi:peroxiredoxin
VIIDLPLKDEQLTDASGWTLKDSGLCRAEACIPVRDRGKLLSDGVIDGPELARLLGRPILVDAEENMAVLGSPTHDLQLAQRDRVAPDFEIPDLDGKTWKLSDFTGKRLLHAFASWCGCRYDLPAWNSLHNQLRAEGHDFTVIAVALDDDPEDVRKWASGLHLPVLIDRDHVVADLFAISNVPCATWIDEHDRIVRPNAWTFGSEFSTEFTGVEEDLDPIRDWVRHGTVPPVTEDVDNALTDAEVEARLHFKLGVHLRDRGREEAAQRHLNTAVELAPFDFTVSRASMSLRGIDPLGQDAYDLYDRWNEAGQPYHGLAPKFSPPAPES